MMECSPEYQKLSFNENGKCFPPSGSNEELNASACLCSRKDYESNYFMFGKEIKQNWFNGCSRLFLCFAKSPYKSMANEKKILKVEKPQWLSKKKDNHVRYFHAYFIKWLVEWCGICTQIASDFPVNVSMNNLLENKCC